MMNKKIANRIILIGLVFGINFLMSFINYRIDATKDKKYTFPPEMIQLLQKVDSPLLIEVFLDGDLPKDFRYLKEELSYTLASCVQENNLIEYRFINPMGLELPKEKVVQKLSQEGMTPHFTEEKVSGKLTRQMIFPWAKCWYKNQTVVVPLYNQGIGVPQREKLSRAIENIPFSIADALLQIVPVQKKSIAVLKGNGQLDDMFMADFLITLKKYYHIAPFTLDSVSQNPNRTLELLQKFPLFINAKPTEYFTEKEKLVLDQYIINGGKSLWLIDGMRMEKDSLFNSSGKNINIALDVNLTDFFFKYGIRINHDIVKSIVSAPITLAVGEGSNTQFQPFPWAYSPLSINTEHALTKNVDWVKFSFASSVDTLRLKGVKKEIVLQSAPQSTKIGTLQTIDLEEIYKPFDSKKYNSGPQNLAVKISGKLQSAYKNKVLPFQINNYKTQGKFSEMFVVSDGNIIKNEVSKNTPIELGFDRFSGQTYGNKNFLLHVVHDLIGNKNLIKIRSKNRKTDFLNVDKIATNKPYWQYLNLLVPILILIIIGGLTFSGRKYLYK